MPLPADQSSLLTQAHLAEEWLSKAPQWQQDLVATMASRPGTDRDPVVSSLVVEKVREALRGDRR